ncbi:carbohydrate porin [Segetibacter koreensis]|uniref:carbohydrate porin n=1 Tax=Segetibacter koreensis TaxID=398037 RepID=UPI0004756BC6|nr:carbohydrate porin [Segetibacter koreensis]
MISLLCSQVLLAQNSIDKKLSIHWQATLIPQYHFKFTSPYQGANSLIPDEAVKTSLTTTFFINYHPFKYTYIVFNPEAAGGKGLSKTLGIAGFPNGEIYRVGNPSPQPYIARLYIEQRFPLPGNKKVITTDKDSAKKTLLFNYVSVLAGKFSITDFFDGSDVSHDPRLQFLNWSLMASGAWDYPANVRGYTMGVVAQAFYNDWKIRSAVTGVPMEANGKELQFKGGDAVGTAIELEKDNVIKKGENLFTNVRLGVFYNRARMGNYETALKKSLNSPDVIATRIYGRSKKGIYGIIDNHFGNILHFVRASYNDGNNETWAFTEIDRSVATGFSFKGNIWKRENDMFGIATVVNGLSGEHRNYLAAGGYGFLIGDGKLNYGTENIVESYYSFNAFKSLYISPDYQFVIHPGYNKDRGPVHIVAIRFHYQL